MLRYVPASSMSSDQFAMLCASGKVGGWTELDVAQKLLGEEWRAFSWKRGMIAISVKGVRMTIEAVAVPNFGASLRSIYWELQRLAAYYKCDIVETMVFNERLAQAMLRVKARPEAWLMTWQVVGAGNGQ